MPVDPRNPDEPTPADAPQAAPGDQQQQQQAPAPAGFDPNAVFQSYLNSQLQTKPTDPEVAAGESLYFKLWGVDPPKGYIHSLVASGMNVYEIAEHEMAKPAFRYTRAYRDGYASFAEQVAQVFGRR